MNQPISKNRRKKRLIMSVCGGAGLFPILMGASARLMKLIRQWAPDHDLWFTGVSAGTLPAVMLGLGYDTPELMVALFKDFARRFGSESTTPDTTLLFKTWRQYVLDLITPDDKWKTLNGKVLIGISVWNSETKELEPRVISRFTSAEMTADTMLTSAHLFLLTLWPVRSFQNQYAADGGLTMRYVQLPERYGTTLPVCYDTVSEHISRTDYSIDFSLEKFTSLFKLGEQMVDRQEAYYLSLIWFGNGSVVHPHNTLPMAPKLDAVSLSLLAALGFTTAAATAVFGAKCATQLGLATAEVVDQVARETVSRRRPWETARQPVRRLIATSADNNNGGAPERSQRSIARTSRARPVIGPGGVPLDAVYAGVSN